MDNPNPTPPRRRVRPGLAFALVLPSPPSRHSGLAHWPL